MGDLRLWSREVITDFIELYKAHPSLWDVKCKQYKNRYTKALAYKELVDFCKKRGFPEADRDFVSRKIQSLRASFRKELRKLEKSQRAGKPYDTSLWYFNNLMFTIIENNAGDDDDDDEDDQSGDDEQFDERGDEDDKILVNKEEEEPSYVSNSPPSTQIKKRKQSDYCPQPEFLDIGQEITNQPINAINQLKDLSEFELTGLSIAKKLARMDEKQAIYAESLINAVIRRGLLKNIKEETDLCDNLCAKRTVRVNLPSQSSNEGCCSRHIQ